MHRLLVDTGALSAPSPTLPASAAHHLDVLRPRPGERIELFDGRGSWREYTFERRAGAAVLVPASDLRRLPRSASESSITLFACVTKGSRWDWTVEKATELGVSRIVPVISERTIVRIAPSERDAKVARWRRIAEEAARQSDAKWLPEIEAPTAFRAALELAAATHCFAGALTDPPPRPLLTELARLSGAAGGFRKGLSLFVGPEGDFTPEELAALIAVATPTSFGPSVLRAETAAVFGLSVLGAYLADDDFRLQFPDFFSTICKS